MQKIMLPAVILTTISNAVFISGMVLAGAGKESSECKAELTLIAPCGLSVKYLKNDTQVDFNAAQAMTNHCSCFRLFERQNYRGRSLLVTRGRFKKVSLRRVRSLARVDCPGQLHTSKERNAKRNKKLDIRKKVTTAVPKKTKYKEEPKDMLSDKNDKLAAKKQSLDEEILKLEKELAMLNRDLGFLGGSK